MAMRVTNSPCAYVVRSMPFVAVTLTERVWSTTVSRR